ncbi:MAG: hypothetical protein IPN76_33290 [Saprospiraceae bacterium]|nr:hypothetical protein [Saprospiraceae bacterium]
MRGFSMFKIVPVAALLLQWRTGSGQQALLSVCEAIPGQPCNTPGPCVSVPVQSATYCPGDEYCFIIQFVVVQLGLTYTVTLGQSGGAPDLVLVGPPNSMLSIRFPIPSLPAGSVTTFTLLSMTDSAGGVYYVSDSQPAVVTIAPEPTNLVISQSGQACFNNPVTLTASNDGGSTSYAWSNGILGATNVIASSGQYTVTATLDNGCTATATANVNYELPQPLGIVVNGPVCAGQPVSVNAMPAAGATFSWSNGTTGQSTTFLPPAIFSVTATTPGGCTATTFLDFTSLPPPLTVSIVGPGTICPNQPAELSSSEVFSSYSWSTGSQSSTISVNSAGTYGLTVTNSIGCTASATQTIVSAPLPTVSFSGPPAVCEGGCQNFTVNFTGTAPFNLTYESQGGITQTQTFTSSTGTIQVCPPAGTPPGATALSAVSLSDRNCFCD